MMLSNTYSIRSSSSSGSGWAAATIRSASCLQKPSGEKIEKQCRKLTAAGWPSQLWHLEEGEQGFQQTGDWHHWHNKKYVGLLDCWRTLEQQGRNWDSPSKHLGKTQERLLEVVVALSWDLVVLQALLPVESHLLCFDLPILHIDLVPTKHNWDVFTDPVSRIFSMLALGY